MKIVRPEQPIKRKEENLSLIIDGHECIPCTKEEMEFEYYPEVEVEAKAVTELQELGKETEQKYQDFMTDVMTGVLEDTAKTVTFNITLTKRQYELYTQKGGICWLKKALVGQAKAKKKKSSKKR